ncbi:MAG: hydrogenase maturation protease [Bacteroidetes bacterium]|nr:hydrogenase maturation protease [Bacteroidota bacterium]
MKASTLILCIGNPLRGDDALGWVVSSHLDHLSDVSVIRAHQILPEHSLLASTVKQVILVDASVAVAPGELSVSRLEPGTSSHKAMGHEFNPDDFLAMIRLYSKQPPVLWQVSVGAVHFNLGQGLSEAVTQRLKDVVGQIQKLITEETEEWTNTHACTC